MGQAPWWSGEPPTSVTVSDAEELFRDLDRELSDADVLRIVDREWLKSAEFRARFEAMLVSFRAHGGRAQFSTGDGSET